MPVAYSKNLIVNGVLRADSPANFITDLELQLGQAGWVLDRHITGGYVYIMTSPDTGSFQAKMLVQDDTSFHAANPTVPLYNFRGPVIRFMNMAESVVSFQHQVLANAHYPSFQTVIGIAQIFISSPGFDGQGWASFAGGIPAIPVSSGACVAGLTPPVITDMWWTCGGSQWGFDFRSQANCYACMCYYLNGVLVTSPDNNNILPANGLLCLFPLTSPDTYHSGAINWPSITYSAHAVLNIDAYLGWGYQIRGQLWDAFLQTGATTLDAINTYLDTDGSGGIFNVDCITWHSEFFSSLVLITGVRGAGSGNEAY